MTTVHSMKLQAGPFEQIKCGQKTIELRLYDEKRQQVKVGDRIVFTHILTGETLETTVVKLHRFETFDALYKSLPLLQCGYTEENVDSASPRDMEQYYSASEQQKYGVVGIEVCCSNGMLIDLTDAQAEYINEQLHLYDREHIQYYHEGSIRIGIEMDGLLVGGLNAYLSAFHILYVDTMFVAEKYRRQGIGRKLICEMEKRAKELGVNTIRLDTFDWQGYAFYKSLGYEEVGHYYNEEDDYHEYFFVKRI